MIDISQIVSNASPKADPASRAAADAGNNAFRGALSRAKDNSQPAASQDSHAKAQPAKDAPAKDTRDNNTAKTPDAKDTPRATAGKTGAQPGRRKDPNDDEDASAQAADASAAAAALAALLPATPTPVAADGAPATAAGSNTVAGAGTAAASGLAALQSPAAASADTTSAAATTLADLNTDTVDTQAAQATVQVATTAKSAPTVADTLANILSQRAVLADASAKPVTTDAAQTAATPNAPLTAAADMRQGHGGQFADSQGQPGAGQPQHMALQRVDSPAQDGKTVAAPFAQQIQVAAQTADSAVPTQNDGAAPAIAAALANQSPSAAPAAVAAAARPVVAPPLNDTQWPQALGQQMIRLTGQGSQSAELQLNPPNLGPLKVVLNVVNDQAQAQFVSPHQAVRAAVEAAIPHLRTALSENGIQLGQTSVGADSFAGQTGNGQQQQQQQAGNSRGHTGFGTNLASAESAPATPVARPARVLAQGEVDTFA
ncbi:flagellar hook-length control protein FliK [Cupriavidus pinatubonensis]|uniref:flagellar hook-length control protein FliK n=1 Tax=Cupriavidus pinatubonensis TaxID=248026 RepID=UPI00112D08EF|nr:flagellar hook-length control protein FliK [Cupriavidus pinatubonensis]TPQ41615.1 flagellar hook-length control protein FliK [Cupriavidus pinatubonensis]